MKKESLPEEKLENVSGGVTPGKEYANGTLRAHNADFFEILDKERAPHNCGYYTQKYGYPPEVNCVNCAWHDGWCRNWKLAHSLE
ncbi:MAG: hypothetical protein LBL98_08015 [Ruminococcus sp.]|jgi:hypothetical protein|nr:hypothetical protein [Ruminococcus sp.]